MATDAMPSLLAVACGRVDYETALAWQHELVRRRFAGTVGDLVLTLEHDRVYTAGRHADVTAHVLGTTDIRVVHVERGGDVTYHGPGQLVGYPIVALPHPKAVRAHVELIEQACVRTAADFGVTARPDRERTGVWVGDEKLAAIGIRVERGVTSHGLAFNVAPDLSDFAGIVPCGIADAGVCSLASLGVPAAMEDVRASLVGHLAHGMGAELREATTAELGLVTASASAAADHG